MAAIPVKKELHWIQGSLISCGMQNTSGMFNLQVINAYDRPANDYDGVTFIPYKMENWDLSDGKILWFKNKNETEIIAEVF